MRHACIAVFLFLIVASLECTTSRAPAPAASATPAVIVSNHSVYNPGWLMKDDTDLTAVAGMIIQSKINRGDDMVECSFSPAKGDEYTFEIDAAQAEKIVKSPDGTRFVVNGKNTKTTNNPKPTVINVTKVLQKNNGNKISLLVNETQKEGDTNFVTFNERVEVSAFAEQAGLFENNKTEPGSVQILNTNQLSLTQKGVEKKLNYTHIKRIKELCKQGTKAMPKYVFWHQLLLKLWQEPLPGNPSGTRPRVAFKIYPKRFIIDTVREDIKKSNPKGFELNIVDKNQRTYIKSVLKTDTISSLAIAAAAGQTEVTSVLDDNLAKQICILCDGRDEPLKVQVTANDSAKTQYIMSLKYDKTAKSLYIEDIAPAPAATAAGQS